MQRSCTSLPIGRGSNQGFYLHVQHARLDLCLCYNFIAFEASLETLEFYC